MYVPPFLSTYKRISTSLPVLSFSFLIIIGSFNTSLVLLYSFVHSSLLKSDKYSKTNVI
nr:MAG TPA: hypothetical protein [Caudoviricetes sp.]